MHRAPFSAGSARRIVVAPLARLALLATLAAMPPAGEAAARPRRAHPAHPARPARLPSFDAPTSDLPSPDAVGLGTLAPPTRLSTLEQSYGDAAFARARARRRDDALVGDRSREAPSAAVLFPCEPRSAGASAYRCGPVPALPGPGVPEYGAPGYGLAYAYNPAYVTSPLSSGHDGREQAPVLPGVTGFFFAVNGLAAGHRD